MSRFHIQTIIIVIIVVVEHTNITFNCIYAKCFAGNSELINKELLHSCCLPVVMYAIEALLPRACDLNSLNNFINTAVAKISCVSFGNSVDFIRQTLFVVY